MKRDSSMKVFSLLFGAVYFLCFFYSVAPFRYYPMTGTFHLDVQPETSGPPILWYGWLAAAAVVSAAIALIVPARWGDRLWHGWLWTVPALTLVLIFIYERRYFQ